MKKRNKYLGMVEAEYCSYYDYYWQSYQKAPDTSTPDDPGYIVTLQPDNYKIWLPIKQFIKTFKSYNGKEL